MAEPLRGEIWLTDLGRTRGREQAGRRPALVISADVFNQGPAGLVVVAPLTTRHKGIPFQLPIAPPEGGVRTTTYVKCDDIRSVAKERLTRRWGDVAGHTLAAVGDRLRTLLEL